MLTCREAVSRLTDLDCGELPESEARETRRHLAGCSSCLAYWRSYRTTVALERRAYRDDPSSCTDIPEDFVQSILAAVLAQPPSFTPALRAIHLLSGIAAAPLLAFWLR